jgi:hypothetical protein
LKEELAQDRSHPEASNSLAASLFLVPAGNYLRALRYLCTSDQEYVSLWRRYNEEIEEKVISVLGDQAYDNEDVGPPHDGAFCAMKGRVSDTVLSEYVFGAPGYEASLRPLKTLMDHCSTTEAEHLLSIASGQVRHLSTVAAALREGTIFREALSEDQILKLSSLSPAAQTVERLFFDNFQGPLNQFIERVEQAAHQRRDETIDVASFRDHLEESLRRAFRLGSASSLSEMHAALDDERLVPIALGLLDREMIVAPTMPCAYPLLTHQEQLQELFPSGINIAQQRSDRHLPAELRDIDRAQVVSRLVHLLEDDRLDSAKPDRLLKRVLDEVPEEELHKVLSECGFPQHRIKIRIAPKSCPDAWTGGNQVNCCATFGAKHQMDTLKRLDAAHLLIETDQQVIGFSRVWCGEDQSTLLCNSVELTGIADVYSVHIRARISQFLDELHQGRIEPLLEGGEPFRPSRAHVGAFNGGIPLHHLPDVAVIDPLGDDPETAGEWNEGHCDADSAQKLLWSRA